MREKINPPVIYQAFIVLMVAVYFFLPSTRIISFPLNLAGCIIFILGAYMAISTKKHFKKMNTPMPPSSKPNLLHVDGAFRYTRNPMYLGIAIGLFGLAILLSSFINFLFPVLFVFIMEVVFIPLEEKILQEQFGEEYIMYKNKVRRWI